MNSVSSSLQSRDVTEEPLARASREQDAGTLQERLPELLSLRLAVCEMRTSGWQGKGYVRHPDLARAPALFELNCSYAHCEGGGFDLTDDVLAGLRLRRTRFEGKVRCSGRCGDVACSRLMHFEVQATYAAQGDGAGARFAEPTAPPSSVRSMRAG